MFKKELKKNRITKSKKITKEFAEKYREYLYDWSDRMRHEIMIQFSDYDEYGEWRI
jgi:hypothetical protein